MNVTLGNHVERATKSVRKLSNVDTEETNRLALYLQENQIWDQVQCRFARRKKRYNIREKTQISRQTNRSRMCREAIDQLMCPFFKHFFINLYRIGIHSTVP